MPILTREEADKVLQTLGTTLDSELTQLDETVSPIFDEFDNPVPLQEPEGIFAEPVKKTKVQEVLDAPLPPQLEDEFPDVKSLSNISRLRKQGYDDTIIRNALEFETAKQESTQTPIPKAPPEQERTQLEFKEGPRTAEEVWGHYVENPLKLVPFISGLEEAREITPILKAALALQNGTETEDDLYSLKHFIHEANRDTTFWGKVMSVVAQLPAFAGELAATWGIYTAGRKVALEGTQAILEKLLKEGGEELLDRRISRIAIKSVGGIAGGTLQTPAAGATRIYAGTLKNMIPGLKLEDDALGEVSVMINSPGESVETALLKAFGEQWVETVSEHSGGLFSELGEPIFKSGIFSSIMRANPSKSVTEFKSMLKRFGWNGVINEMWEERVGEVGRAALGLEDWKLPSPEQLAVELVSFSIPGASIAVTGKVIETGEKIEREKQLNNVVTKFNEDDIPFTIEFDDENTGESVESESWIRARNYDPEIEGFEQVGEENGEKQYRVIKLGLNDIDSETGSVKVLLNSKVGRDVAAEEVVEGFFKQAERTNPELAEAIRAYAGGLRQSLIEAGYPPGVSDIELFSKAFVFHHLGYANNNPEYAYLYNMPQEMYSSFVEFMGDFSDGTNIAEFLTGGVELESAVFEEEEVEAIAGQAIAEDKQERAPPSEESFQIIPAYHYSQEYGLTEISPEHMASTTNADSRRVANEGAPQRQYFYLGDKKEPSITTAARVKYQSPIDTDDYYDLNEDSLGLWDKHNNNRTEIEHDIQSQGYKGYIGLLGGDKDMPVLASFYDVPVQGEILKQPLKRLSEENNLPQYPSEQSNILGDIELALQTLFNKNGFPTGQEMVDAVRNVKRWKRLQNLKGYKELVDILKKQIKKNPESGNWYDSVAQLALDIIGEKNIVEFSGVFGITSSQASPEVNFAQTLFVMRMARKFNPILNEKEFKDAIKNEPILSGGKFLGGGQINKISKFYNHGEFSQSDRFKTPVYAQTIKERAFNEFFPYTVQDTHMARLFGLNTQPNPTEYRLMNYLTIKLAQDSNLRPDVVQALLWDYMRGKGRTPGSAESIRGHASEEIEAFDNTPLQSTVFPINVRDARIAAFTKGFAVTPTSIKGVKEHAERFGPKIALELTRSIPENASPEMATSVINSISDVLFVKTRTGLKLKLAEELGVANKVEQSTGTYKGAKSPNYIISYPGSSIDVAEQISSIVSKALHQEAQFVFKIQDGKENAFIVHRRDGEVISEKEQDKFLSDTGLDYTLINDGQGLLVYPYDNYDEASIILNNLPEEGNFEAAGVSLDARFKEKKEYETQYHQLQGLTRGPLDTESWANDNLFNPLNEIIRRNPEFFGGTKEKLPSRETYRLEPGLVSKQGFYSTARVALNKFPESMNALSVKNWLRKNQVKPEEIEWLDLESLLKGKKKVSKQELSDWVAAHEIVVDEVERHEKLKEGWDVINKENGEIYYTVATMDEAAKLVRSEGRDGELSGINLVIDKSQFTEGTVSYSKQVLPGGEDYRELVLTLPGTGKSPDMTLVWEKIDGEWVSNAQYLSQEHIGDTDSYIIKKENDYYVINNPNGYKTDAESLDDAKQYVQRQFENQFIEGEIPDSGDFKSPHFEEPNILAHIRFNTRYDENGNKVLFIEEIQSDWHQEGAQEGYSNKPKKITEIPDNYEIKQKLLINGEYDWQAKQLDTGFNIPFRVRAFNQEEAESELLWWLNAKEETLSSIGVPNAPFKGDGWLHLSLKRMLRYAAENDFDTLSWTTGTQQVERYETATRAKVDKIHWQRSSIKKLDMTAFEEFYEEAFPHNFRVDSGEHIDMFWVYDIEHYKKWRTRVFRDAPEEQMDDERVAIWRKVRDKYMYKPSDSKVTINGIKNDRSIGIFTIPVTGSTNINGKNVTLDGLIGKHMAQKIRESEERTGILEGGDLTIGGEGMKLWYDNKIPSFLKKYGKKWGIKVGRTNMFDRDKQQMEAFSEEIQANETPFTNPSISITPKMKHDVLEGQPTFRLEGQKIPGWVYDDLGSEKPKIKVKDKPNAFYQMAILPISQRLFRINPELKRRVRNFDYKVLSQTEATLQRVMPFINAINKLDAEEKAKLDLSLKNGDSEMLDIIFERNKGLKRKYMPVRKVLDELYDRAQQAGFEMGFIDEYFPRMLADYEGFIEYMYGTYNKGVLDKEIKAMEKDIGRKLTMEEQAELISARIRGFGSKIHEGKPGSMKTRKVPFITGETNEFYHSLEHSLTHYISNMVNAIETRDFFQSTELTEESIGNWVSNLLDEGKIKPEQQEELVHILKIRFNPQPISVGANNFRALGYITSMGSISSAITQIGDLTWAFYMAPAQSLGAWGQSVAGKSKIKKSDIGIDRIAQEFSDFGGLSKGLNTLFKLTGLEWMDKLGKETLINATIQKYQKLAKSGKIKEHDMYRRLEEAFGEETGKVIGDLKRGVITENVKYLAFYTLADFQPISLSEMPEGYLKSPNGRILYMLKTFTIKQFDAFRNESINLIRKGKREDNQRLVNKGVKNMIMLATIFMLANASADAIKDLIFKRPIKMKDYVLDNILRLFGVHRYLYFYAQRYGLWNTAWRAVSPPVDIIEAPFRDVKDLYKLAEDNKLENFRGNELESIKMVPLFGKLYYWWFGKGPRILTEREIKDARKASKTTIFDIDAEKEYKHHLDYALEMGWFDEDKYERWLNDYGKAQRKLKGEPEPRRRRGRKRRSRR